MTAHAVGWGLALQRAGDWRFTTRSTDPDPWAWKLLRRLPCSHLRRVDFIITREDGTKREYEFQIDRTAARPRWRLERAADYQPYQPRQK